MASVVAGAAISGIASLAGTIQQGVSATQERKERARQFNDQLAYQKQIDQLKLTNSLDIEQKRYDSAGNVATINTSGNLGVANIDNATRLQLQSNTFQNANFMMQNSIKALKSAGLPEYLAYIAPSKAVIETRQTRGVNFQDFYKGSNANVGAGGLSG